MCSEASDVTAARRALIGRISDTCKLADDDVTGFVANTSVLVLQCAHKFEFSKSCDRQRCGTATSWAADLQNPFEAIAKGGRRLGSTRKTCPTKSMVSVCRARLFQVFKDTCRLIPAGCELSECLGNVEGLSYGECKDIKSRMAYRCAWLRLRQRGQFSKWIQHDRKLDEFY